ncbi:MAG: hypothetical protein R3224_03670 [Balneolaceae bacterium]|nr:hypothetical protein [Balneolaceae bacterium]
MKKLVLIIGLVIVSSPLVKAQTVEPPSGMSELQAYSIFYENYKNEDFNSAIRFGRWIYKNMPSTLKGYSRFDLERNLERLIRAYGELSKKKEDPTLRSAYIDTALIIFDKVFEQFDESQIDMFNWRFQQGRFYQEHSDFIDDGMEKAYTTYEQLFEMNPERFSKLGDGYYAQVTVQNLVSNNEKDAALEIIDTAEPHVSSKVQGYFDTVRNQLFSSPKERMAFLESKLEENPDSTEIIKDLADLYQQEQMLNQARQMREKLYQQNPNFENTRALADIAINNANYDTAIKYLNEALGKTDDSTDKSRVALKLSEAHLNKENLQQARRYARQAANLDSDWGDPYLQIASIYAQAVSNCTSGRKIERQDKVVYWLILDYLDRARNVDSSVASRVKQQYQSYQPVTPTTEEKFFNNWKEGQKMEVDESLMPCYDWINETTTVR